MQIAETRNVVTVSSTETEALDTTSNVIGTMVDFAQIQQLPLNACNFLNLTLLAGGAADISPANNVYTPTRVLSPYTPGRCR